MSVKIKISDFVQDERNFNAHTVEGMDLLKKSIEKVGIIESITVSADDKIISGNARQQKIGEVMGDADPIVIETDGTRPVVLKRTDIQSGTKEFHEAALLANTTAKKNINLDMDLIQEVAVEEFGIDVEEVGVETIALHNSVDLSSFFDGSNYQKGESKPVICPHCGKNINDYETGTN
ncbi:MAG: hypothetical protein LBC84_09240 [Prevotellaceae bacterium]|jgi:hypothetical protein|nr:hypothetical protein [Prevotellaceae bacterium]